MVYPNPQIYHHLKTIFVHVPKTAGTSVEKALLGSPKDVVGGHTTALGFRKTYPGEFASYFKFAIVRHPVQRFVSAYRYLLQFPIHDALNNRVIHELETMERFLDKLEESPDLIHKIVHFIPQHEFVCDAGGVILVDAVYNFENLAEAWENICARLGTSGTPLSTLNASRQEPISERDKGRLSSYIAELYARDFQIFGYESGGFGAASERGGLALAST